MELEEAEELTGEVEEEPEVIENNDPDVKPLDLAPPMQQDVPQLVQPDSFVQKIQPPPPEGVTISAAMNIVPEVRDPNMFKGMKVFDISMLDQTPVPKFQARPQYPFEMRRAGIAGEVVVDFIVDTNGDVQNAYALRSSQREFEAAIAEFEAAADLGATVIKIEHPVGGDPMRERGPFADGHAHDGGHGELHGLDGVGVLGLLLGHLPAGRLRDHRGVRRPDQGAGHERPPGRQAAASADGPAP